MSRDIIIPFIGREKELELIHNTIYSSSKSNIIRLRAEGGIGKTRLLKKLLSRYTTDEKMIVIDIIDYDSYQILNIEHIESAIIDVFPEGTFAEFESLKKDFNNQQISEKLQKLIFEKFITAFNHAIESKKMLFFIDTIEKIEDEVFWRKLQILTKDLENITLILSGRENNFSNETTLFDKYSDNFSNVSDLKLEPFSVSESQKYLNKKCKLFDAKFFPKHIERDLIDLVKGKPILLDLVIEWAVIQDDFNDSVKEIIGLQDIDDNKKSIEFEKNLVNHLGEENIVRIMSLQSPLTLELYNKILNELYDESVSEKDFREIQQTTYIKDLENGTIVFHDEMDRLVKEHLVPDFDESYLKEMESRIFKITAEYYKEKLSGLDYQQNFVSENDFVTKYRKKYEYEQYVVLLVKALFKTSGQSSEAYKTLKTEFAKAKSEYNYKLMKKLISVSCIDTLVSLEQKADYITMNAKTLSVQGHNQDAKKLIENYIMENKPSEKAMANLYNMLAGIETSIGELLNAKEHQSKAYMFFENNKQLDAIIYSSAHMSKINEELGDFKKAIEYSENALVLDNQIDCLKSDERATILNRLSNLYRFESDYYISAEQVEDALKIKVLNEKTIALLKITKGNLLRDDGKYYEAMKCYEDASNVITELNDIEKVLQLYLGRGLLYLFQYYDNKNILDLDSALNDFTKVEEVSIKYSSYYSELVEVQSHLARVYWEKNKKNKARAKLASAKKMSIEHQQVYFIVDLVLASAEFDYKEKNYENIEEYKLEIIKYQAESQFPLFYGRMLKIEANIKFNQEKYAEAMKLYVDALSFTDKHKGYSIYTTKEFLGDLSNKLLEIISDNEEFKNLLTQFETEIKEMKQKAKLDSSTEKKLIQWLNRLRFKKKMME